MGSMNTVTVVGASLAGLRACETLRAEGFTGTIELINPEPGPLYDRPPLSKNLLAGQWEPERIALRKPEAFAALELSVREDRRAIALDVSSASVTLDDGSVVAGDAVIIATGADARRLPDQPSLEGLHELRTLSDALRLRDDLVDGSRLVVVGAGFIGLEAAATARARGCEVTVLEGAPVPLARALGPEIGHAIAEVHRRHDVEVRCGVAVQGFESEAGRVTAVLTDGGPERADTVLVGIGVRPAVDWLEGSGLELRDGIVCDDTLRAAPRIFAAGDVARWPNALYSDVEADMRVEHWTNAAEQGAIAARNCLADAAGTERAPYVSAPFFWSDQFEAKIQFLGRSHAEAEVDVVAGDLASGRFCAAYSLGGVLRGVLGVSMPKLVMPSRSLIERRATRQEALAHFAERTAT
jgi:NADPH-dependent 2,4-dienoyl-CoA reductase/sulfur reductase-like enzyme